MWGSRNRLVGIQDVMRVPGDVRRALAGTLPPRHFTLYSLSPHHLAALTHPQEHPYELYLAFVTAHEHPRVVEALVAERRHERFAALLPPGADASLPICRDVWSALDQAGGRQLALDVLYPCGADGDEAPGFPVVANVLVFSEEAAGAGDFRQPVGVELGVPLTFERGL